MYEEEKYNMQKGKSEVEQELDKLRKKKGVFLENEEEEEWEISQAHKRLEEEMEFCTLSDVVLRGLIDERKEILGNIEKEKLYFYEEAEKWFLDKRRELELQIENIEKQINDKLEKGGENDDRIFLL